MGMVLVDEKDLQQMLDTAVERGMRAILDGASPADEILDRNGIAALLGVSPKSLAKMVARHGLPVVTVQGRYRARRSQIEAWLDQQLASATVRRKRHSSQSPK